MTRAACEKTRVTPQQQTQLTESTRADSQTPYAGDVRDFLNCAAGMPYCFILRYRVL